MPYNEAILILQGYLDSYIMPNHEIEEAVKTGILALERCAYLDEVYEKKKAKKNK